MKSDPVPRLGTTPAVLAGDQFNKRRLLRCQRFQRHQTRSRSAHQRWDGFTGGTSSSVLFPRSNNGGSRLKEQLAEIGRSGGVYALACSPNRPGENSVRLRCVKYIGETLIPLSAAVNAVNSPRQRAKTKRMLRSEHSIVH